MMSYIFHFFPLFSLTCYVVASVHAVGGLLRGTTSYGRGMKLVLYAGLFSHAVFFLFQYSNLFVELDRGLHFSDSLSLISFFVVVAFVLKANHKRFASLGAFILPLGTLFLILSGGLFHFSRETHIVQGSGTLLGVHLLLAVLGNVFLVLAFCISIAVLLVEKNLKQHRLSPLLRRLPPLMELDTLNGEAVSLGFALMLGGIVTGMLYGWQSGVGLLLLDSRILWSAAVLAVYTTLFVFRVYGGWRGSRAAWLSTAGFLLLVGSFCGVNLYGGSFHAF